MKRRSGTILLECVIALAIVGIAGAALLSLASQSLRGAARAAVADNQSRDASAFLDVVWLWSRAELEQRLGDRRQGPYMLTIQRPDPAQFHVTLSDSARRRILLSTILYRPDHVASRP